MLVPQAIGEDVGPPIEFAVCDGSTVMLTDSNGLGIRGCNCLKSTMRGGMWWSREPAAPKEVEEVPV